MNILIINTAFDYADYIVLTNEMRYVYKTDSNAKHSETSLKFIDNALNKCNISIKDLDVIAVNLGPGSFTGIRIGVALAKGFVSAIPRIKMIGFNSFEPLIERINGRGNIYIETGKSDYYYAHVDAGEINDMGCRIDVDEDEYFTILSGEPKSSYKEDELINLVQNKINQNQYCEANELEPLYIKLSQAEQDLLNNKIKRSC